VLKAIVSIAHVALLFAASIFFAVAGENLFWRGAGVFLFGTALTRLAFDPRLADTFATLKLPPIRVYRVSATLYILAAVLMAIAAVTRLHPIFAAVVVLACLSWILLFAHALRLTRSEN
jgi:hypothetical protein